MEDKKLVQLNAVCPVCDYENNENTLRKNWCHHQCGGDLFVGDDANFYCNKCESQWYAGNTKIKMMCMQHGDDEVDGEIEFIPETTPESFAVLIALAGQFVCDAGIPWLHKFLENLED